MLSLLQWQKIFSKCHLQVIRVGMYGMQICVFRHISVYLCALYPYLFAIPWLKMLFYPLHCLNQLIPMPFRMDWLKWYNRE